MQNNTSKKQTVIDILHKSSKDNKSTNCETLSFKHTDEMYNLSYPFKMYLKSTNH